MTEDRVLAVERALTILDAFTEDRSEMSLAALAEATGLHKSTILRLGASLMRFGYLLRGADGVFRPGPAPLRLGALYRKGFDLADRVRPELRWLVEQTGETASFYVREGDSRVCLLRQNATRPIRHHLDEGARLPLDKGASARVLRAFGHERGSAAARVRARGYHVSHGERDPDVAAVAVPVIGRDRALIGALAVSGLRSRFTEALQNKTLRCLRASVRRLAEATGGREPG